MISFLRLDAIVCLCSRSSRWRHCAAESAVRDLWSVHIDRRSPTKRYIRNKFTVKNAYYGAFLGEMLQARNLDFGLLGFADFLRNMTAKIEWQSSGQTVYTTAGKEFACFKIWSDGQYVATLSFSFTMAFIRLSLYLPVWRLLNISYLSADISISDQLPTSYRSHYSFCFCFFKY